MFSARICRLWTLLSDEEQNVNIKSKKELNKLGSKFRPSEKDWILWGKGETPSPAINRDNVYESTSDGSENDGPHDETTTGNQSRYSHFNQNDNEYNTNDGHENGSRYDENTEGEEAWTTEEIKCLLMLKNLEEEAKRREGVSEKEFSSDAVENTSSPNDDEKK